MVPQLTPQAAFLNRTARVTSMGAVIRHWHKIQETNPGIELVFGETNMWSNSHDQEPLETVFGSSLFYVDYCMYGVSQVCSPPT